MPRPGFAKGVEDRLLRVQPGLGQESHFRIRLDSPRRVENRIPVQQDRRRQETGQFLDIGAGQKTLLDADASRGAVAPANELGQRLHG